MPARAIGHSGDAGEIAVRAPQKFFCIPLQGRRRQFSLAVKLHNVTARAPKPKKAPRSVIIIAFGGAPDLSKQADRVVSARLARLCRLACVRTSANNGRVRPAVLPCEILPKSPDAASEKLTQTPPPVFGAACEI